MSRHSVSERIFIVRTYYSNNNSPIVTQRKFETEFKLKTTGPSVSTINRLIQNLERTGSVSDDMFGNVGRPLSVKTPEKIERTRLIVPMKCLICLKSTSMSGLWLLGYPKSKNMGIDWPPYSPDLNPCDSFLWGYIKDKVYAGNPQSIEDLKTAIQTVIESIETSTLQLVLQNFALLLRHIIAIDGRHIEHVIN
ncbi:hypothetical protein AVEN_43185-1 [Araneus ventricosus]|uniref:DUF4817 domain-containing protein n=1 Tax=Araneus ventricosus TaxID=182803 RepID=A0A4Y2F177_ARAVE|nr:hypothetical protein AVEN_43185-1 [Araneus ventricosus]